MSMKKTLKPTRRSRTESRPGQAPGTISVDAHSLMSRVHVTVFDRDSINEIADASVSDIPTANDNATIWVDVTGLGDESVIKAVADHFGVHKLSLEDVVSTHQRPKLEVFDDHLFIVARMPQYKTPQHDDELKMEQVSLFIGKGYVLTWQEYAGDCFTAVRERLRTPTRAVRQHESDFLAYALIDSIVDSYFPLINQLGDELEQIEDDLAGPEGLDNLMRRLFRIRSDVRALRRVSWSHRDTVRSWMGYSGPFTSEATQLHLRDVYDHSIRIVELLEGCREACSDLRDLHMSTASMRMNEVMKVLTVIATIFMPLGFIAGLYGMNFATDSSPWNMPETQWYLGYPFALFVMAGVAIGMLVFFRRKGWIGRAGANGRK